MKIWLEQFCQLCYDCEKYCLYFPCHLHEREELAKIEIEIYPCKVKKESEKDE